MCTFVFDDDNDRKEQMRLFEDATRAEWQHTKREAALLTTPEEITKLNKLADELEECIRKMVYERTMRHGRAA